MRIALVSPLPPAPTGVAEYTVRLRGALEECARAGGQQITIETAAQFTPDSLRGFDVCVYQIGNNRLHADAYRAALETPGLLVDDVRKFFQTLR